MDMTDKRLVLHVGPHKTASTYIQENLFKERQFLAGQGWTYPEAGTDFQAAHHHLAHNSTQYLGDEAPRRFELQSLAEKVHKAGQNLIFSAEGFCRWKPADFEALADILGFSTIELVYVVRDPLDVFHSFWSEEVKQGRTLGFADRFAREFAAPLASRILNPMNDLAPLLARQRVRLHVVPFNILRRRKIDIYEHIGQQVLGLPQTTARHVEPANTKYPAELTEFLRLLTLMYSGDKPNVGSSFRLRFTRETTPEERRKMIQVVRAKAAHAKRVIKVPAGVFYITIIEKRLKLRLQNVWTLDVSKESLFQMEDKKYVYYNEHLLWKTEPVRHAAEELLKRLAD